MKTLRNIIVLCSLLEIASFPSTAAPCGGISATLETDSIFSISGQVAQIDATSYFTSTGCEGAFQYKFLSGGDILADWSSNPVFNDSPVSTRVYEVQGRCSSELSCNVEVQVQVLALVALGAASLTIGPQDNLIVSNMGSTGFDGFSLGTAGASGVSLLMPSFVNPSELPNGAFMRVSATNGTDTWSVTQQVAPGKLQAFYSFSPSTSYTIHSSCDGGQNVSVVNSSGFGVEIDAAVAVNIAKHETVATGQDGTLVIRWVPVPSEPGG